MNIKENLPILVIASLLIVVLLYKSSPSNRYQIISNSEHNFGMFLLDKKTGRTWRYTRSSREDANRGVIYEAWSLVDNAEIENSLLKQKKE